jgi:hypothetical protein
MTLPGHAQAGPCRDLPISSVPNAQPNPSVSSAMACQCRIWTVPSPVKTMHSPEQPTIRSSQAVPNPIVSPIGGRNQGFPRVSGGGSQWWSHREIPEGFLAWGYPQRVSSIGVPQWVPPGVPQWGPQGWTHRGSSYVGPPMRVTNCGLPMGVTNCLPSGVPHAESRNLGTPRGGPQTESLKDVSKGCPLRISQCASPSEVP